MKTCLKKPLIIALLLFVSAPSLYAQRDTIFFIARTKTACFVKEIDPDVIVYTLRGEDVINTVYRNTVQKIRFRNGRVQVFTEIKAYKHVEGLKDYENVSVTTDENNVQGLYKLGDLSTRATKGAEKRLKMQAALMGANVIYIVNQNTNTSADPDDATLFPYVTAQAYTSTVPDADKFKKLIGSRTDYAAKQTYALWGNANNVSAENSYRRFTIKNVNNDDGIISIEGKLKDEKDVSVFQLTGFNDDAFSISYSKENTVYNVVVSMEKVTFLN